MAWGEEGIGGTERLLVVIASIVGLFGIIAAMVMFHNLDIIPEGIMVAAVCMLFTILGWYRLAKEFRDRPEHLPLKPWEDLGTAVVLVLPHAAVVSIFLQIHYSFLMSFPADGGEYTPNAPSGAHLEYNPATGGYIEGSRPLFAAQLAVEMLLGCVQMWFLTGLARRYPNLARHNPRYDPPPPPFLLGHTAHR